jgi:predicted Zn-dependent protease
LIELLQNEAQLAAVMGHEIAHSVQEHSWRQMQFHKKKRIGLAIVSAVAAAYGQYDLSNLVDMVQGAIQNGHSRSLENQADRVGLEYMVNAGYDPREAPRVWKLMAKEYGVQSTNFFWSTHENQATRRSYLMNELKNNYRTLDYAGLKTNEETYQRMQSLVRSSVDQKMRLKVR